MGTLKIWPNSINTVPGSVELSLDIRDLSPDVISHMIEQLRRKIETVAVASRTRIRIRPELEVEPTPASATIQALIVKSCEEIGFTYTHLAQPRKP